MIVAYLALFVALGGSAVAAKTAITGTQIKNSTITSADIKNRSLKGADVANNTLTGTQIKESTLGTVPNATNALNATNAGNANTVGGVTAASLKLSCPAGTELAAGNLCFETAERAAQGLEGAWNTCGDAGRRLPWPSELRAFARQPDVTLPSAEITDGLFNNGGFQAVIVQETGLSTSNDATFPRPFRCVTNPTN